MTSANNSAPSAASECYVEQRHRAGKVNRKLSYPDDGGIPKVPPHLAHVRPPSLMETAFGIAPRSMPVNKAK